MQLKELSQFSDDPAPAVTRILFTEHDILARKYVFRLQFMLYLSCLVARSLHLNFVFRVQTVAVVHHGSLSSISMFAVMSRS